MISRRSAIAIAWMYETKFTDRFAIGPDVLQGALYDFLFEFDHPAWFCNAARRLRDFRDVLEFVMKFHTGETLVEATHGWTWEDRQKLGQRYLRDLAEDFLQWYHGPLDGDEETDYAEEVSEAKKSLELDGYAYSDGVLLAPESDVLDAKEESGVLQSLYVSLGLNEKKTAFHHLELSATHYMEGHWGDSISNSRKFLECVLTQTAAKHSLVVNSAPLSKAVIESPRRVREYLEREELLETKEKKALAAVYGLLSQTGGHPYMAENDQARLLRHLALTFCQFVMLRLRGRLEASG